MGERSERPSRRFGVKIRIPLTHAAGATVKSWARLLERISQLDRGRRALLLMRWVEVAGTDALEALDVVIDVVAQLTPGPSLWPARAQCGAVAGG